MSLLQQQKKKQKKKPAGVTAELAVPRPAVSLSGGGERKLHLPFGCGLMHPRAHTTR